jgi:hypothetical protein
MQSFVQEDPMACPSEAVSEFDIFDASRKTLLVKTANFFKCGAAHCAAASPKSRSLRVAFLMHEVVQQVPILGNHAFDSG